MYDDSSGDEYYDSSEDEDNVTTNPYEGVPLATASEMITPLTVKKLNNLIKNESILKTDPDKKQTHQHLLHNAAVLGKKKPDAANKSPSKFPAALQEVKKVLNAYPSKPEKQSDLPNTIVPSFRGILWPSNINPLELFFSTRVDWVGEHNYSSKAFTLAGVGIGEHTLAKFASNEELRKRYEKRDLASLDALSPNQLDLENARLIEYSKKLKTLFDYADSIKNPFAEWFHYFPEMRGSKKLEGTNCSLSEILSYIYVNNYDYFKEVFSKFDDFVASLPQREPGVAQFKKYYSELKLTQDELASGIPYLSEGQIPRHALLYSFGVKSYATAESVLPKPLYKQDLKPIANKAYLGKLLVTKNPHTLFKSPDKAVSIPAFDKEHGGGVIAKHIIGELEIQSRGANLQGIINKDINTKLPKFHHKKAPDRYKAKYGLDQKLYRKFKATFEFLGKANEYGKLSWLYLETVLLAHLIQFHEIQLYKYSNKMAKDIDKEIFWVNRDNEEIKNPCP